MIEGDSNDKDQKAPQYNLTEKVEIQSSVLKSLIKYCENNNNIEGLLYGYEDDEKVKVENLVTLSINHSKEQREAFVNIIFLS
jgi:hypothetical protein